MAKIAVNDDVELFKKNILDFLPTDTRPIIIGGAAGIIVSFLCFQSILGFGVGISLIFSSILFGIPMFLFGLKKDGLQMICYIARVAAQSQGINYVYETKEMREKKVRDKKAVKEYVEKHYSKRKKAKFYAECGKDIEKGTQWRKILAEIEKSKNSTHLSPSAKSKAGKMSLRKKEKVV